MSEEKQKITEKRAAMFSSARQDWATPQDLFDELNEEFHFNLDPCANAENHKCERYFTEEDNGLLQEWGGDLPFSAIHHTAQSQRENGSKSATTKAGSPDPSSLCLFRRELTRRHFTNTYTTKRKSVS